MKPVNTTIGACLLAMLVVFASSAPLRPVRAGGDDGLVFIESPDRKQVLGNAINGSGQVVGEYTTNSGERHAYSWDSESGFQDLGELTGANITTALALNDDGVTVGASNPGGSFKPVIWTPGQGISPLTLSKNEAFGAASGINDAGTVCGYGAPNAFSLMPKIWKVPNQPISLGIPKGLASAQAVGINSGGDVLVMGNTSQGRFMTFLWIPTTPNGTTGAYGPPIPGLIPNGDVVGTALNDSRQIVGMAVAPDFSYHAFRRDTMETIDFGKLPNGGGTRANALNNEGEAAGSAIDSTGAVKAVGFPISLLNALITPGLVDLSVATGINSAGTIVANGKLLTNGPGGTTTGTDVAAVLKKRRDHGLTIHKTAEPSIAEVGETIVFTIEVRNLLKTSRRWTVEDIMPTDENRKEVFEVESFTSSRGKRQSLGNVFQVAMEIPGDSLATVTIVATAKQAGEFQNTAVVIDTDLSVRVEQVLPVTITEKRPEDVTEQGVWKPKTDSNGVDVSATWTYRGTRRTSVDARRGIKGPFYVVLENLQNAALANKTGVAEGKLSGSPYIKVDKKSLKKGKKLKVKLDFTAKGEGPITYTPRILAGPGVP